ncbi:MAG: hypothetical protein JST73_12535 [Actinobacteria bacterium]|nr:hypothetical protein [Actinomycetota bacterium]
MPRAAPGEGRLARPRWADIGLILLGAFAGAFAAAWWTSHGLLSTLDTFTFFSVAQHLGEGHGLTSPFPPLFSDLPITDQIAHAGRIPLSQ